MIYNLKQLNEELKNENQQLCEKFIGIKGTLEKVGKYFYITGYRLQIQLDPQKIKEHNIKNLKGHDYFFGFINQRHELGRQHLKRGAHKENFEDVYFNPIFYDGLPNFLKDQERNIKKGVDVKAYAAECWKCNKPLTIAVICSKRSRVYPDLLTGINHFREFKQLEGRFCFKHHNVEYKQQKEEKTLIKKFIQVLNRVDKQRYDMVAIIRGGSDKNRACILDTPEIHAALLTMKTITICGVGHTNEHPEFKKYCDFFEETPSLLGVTLGTWAEEFFP